MKNDLTSRIEQDVRVAQKRLGELATVHDILRWINHQCHRDYTLEQVELALTSGNETSAKSARA